MENIDMKKVIIAILLVIVIGVGIFFGVKAILEGRKNYTLEEIAEEDYQYFAVYTNGKYGVLNAKGEMIIQNTYANIVIPNPTKPVFICKKANGIYEALNEKGEKILGNFSNVKEIETNEASSAWPYEKSVLQYEEDGKYGLISYEGKIITKAIYDEIASVKYKEGEILAKKDGKYGVINNKGVQLIPFAYDEIEADRYQKEGYKKTGYIVKNKTDNGYRYGYINYKWKKILDTEYTGMSRILEIDGDDIYLIVAKNGQYGVLKNKKTEIDFAYQSISYNQDTNLLLVQKSEQYGVINLEGESIVPVQYKTIRFGGAYISAKGYEEDAYFNAKGEKMTNGYTGMKAVADLECYITTKNNLYYGLVDKNQNVLVENEYLYMDYAFDHYFIAYKEGKGLGVINQNNQVIVDFGYDVLTKIADKKLLKGVNMGKTDVTTIYSKDMKKVATLSEMSISIYDDYIKIYNQEQGALIDNDGNVKSGEELLKGNKLFAISQNGKWGYQDASGAIKVEPTYDFVTELNHYGFAGVKKDGKWGVINENR